MLRPLATHGSSGCQQGIAHNQDSITCLPCTLTASTADSSPVRHTALLIAHRVPPCSCRHQASSDPQAAALYDVCASAGCACTRCRLHITHAASLPGLSPQPTSRLRTAQRSPHCECRSSRQRVLPQLVGPRWRFPRLDLAAECTCMCHTLLPALYPTHQRLTHMPPDQWKQSLRPAYPPPPRPAATQWALSRPSSSHHCPDPTAATLPSSLSAKQDRCCSGMPCTHSTARRRVACCLLGLMAEMSAGLLRLAPPNVSPAT